MKKLTLGVLALSSSVLLTGCGGSSSSSHSGQDDRSVSESGGAFVRALHLSPDAPEVDVLLNGGVVLGDVAYRDASGFLDVAAGSQNISVNVANTESVVIDANLSLQDSTKYTILAVNNVATIEPLIIEDSSAPAAGFSQLTVVHGAPAVPSVDVYVSGPSDDFELLTATLAGVPFKAISAELEVPAGDYRVRITLNEESDVIFDSGSLSLVDGVEYVAVASEVTAGLSPIGLTILTDTDEVPFVLVDDARARVRVVHASADAPEVDISVDGEEVLSDVPFGVGSGYLEVLGNSYNIDVTASSSGTSVINADLAFDPRNDYTVIALNALADIEAIVLVDDNSEPADGAVKVRLLHAAPSAGTVDVYVTSPGADISSLDPTVSGFEFKASSNYLEVPAGNYQVRIAVANSKTVALDTGSLTLPSGGVITAIALDPSAPGGDFGALLLNDLD